MDVKIILQNTKSQLEAQKQKAYDEAYNSRLANLTPELNAFAADKKKEYDDAAVALRTAYDNAIAAKKAEIAAQATAYAQTQVAVVEKSISDLNAMIEACG